MPIQECSAVCGPADDLTAGINAQRETAGIAILSSEICHRAMLPEKRVVKLRPRSAWQIRLTHDLSRIVE
jgi:hypothetical protein